MDGQLDKVIDQANSLHHIVRVMFKTMEDPFLDPVEKMKTAYALSVIGRTLNLPLSDLGPPFKGRPPYQSTMTLINKLAYVEPAAPYGLGDRVFKVLSTPQEFEQAISENPNIGNVVGLDIEYPPGPPKPKTRRARWTLKIKGVILPRKPKISCLQIAGTEGPIFVLWNKGRALQLPQSVRNMLENPEIVKTGVEIKADAERICSEFGVALLNLVDLSDLAKSHHPDLWVTKGNERIGLCELVRGYLGRSLSKEEQVGGWDNPTLSDNKAQYAALDALAGLQVFMAIPNGPQIKPVWTPANMPSALVRPLVVQPQSFDITCHRVRRPRYMFW